jgi:hypothetical protein
MSFVMAEVIFDQNVFFKGIDVIYMALKSGLVVLFFSLILMVASPEQEKV